MFRLLDSRPEILEIAADGIRSDGANAGERDRKDVGSVIEGIILRDERAAFGEGNGKNGEETDADRNW